MRSDALAGDSRTWHPGAVNGSRPHALSHRALWGAVVALCVVAQLTSAAHLVLVPHTFCVEHGVAVDAPASAERSTRHPCDALLASLERSDHAAGGDAHNHCELAVDRSDRIGLPPRALVLVPAQLLVEPARAPAHAALAPGSGVISFAPKTSPPA